MFPAGKPRSGEPEWLALGLGSSHIWHTHTYICRQRWDNHENQRKTKLIFCVFLLWEGGEGERGGGVTLALDTDRCDQAGTNPERQLQTGKREIEGYMQIDNYRQRRERQRDRDRQTLDNYIDREERDRGIEIDRQLQTAERDRQRDRDRQITIDREERDRGIQIDRQLQTGKRDIE